MFLLKLYRVSKGLDPDQAKYAVGPGLDISQGFTPS